MRCSPKSTQSNKVGVIFQETNNLSPIDLTKKPNRSCLIRRRNKKLKVRWIDQVI
jgi:hypothetical protein